MNLAFTPPFAKKSSHPVKHSVFFPLSMLASCLIGAGTAQGKPETPPANALGSGIGEAPGTSAAITLALNELDSRALKNPETANQLVKEFLVTWLAPRTGAEDGSAGYMKPLELMGILDKLSKVSGLNLGPMEAAPQVRRFVGERAFYPLDRVAATPNSTTLVGILSKSSSPDRIRMMAAMLRAMCEFDKSVANPAPPNPKAAIGSESKPARNGSAKSADSVKGALEAVLYIVREGSGLDLPVSRLADVLMPICCCAEPANDQEAIEFAFRFLAIPCNATEYGARMSGGVPYRNKEAAVAAGREVFDKDLIRQLGKDCAAVMSVKGKSGSHFIAVVGYDVAGRQFMVRDPSGQLPDLVPYDNLVKMWPKENTTTRNLKVNFFMTVGVLQSGFKPTAPKPIPGFGEMKTSAQVARLASTGLDLGRMSDKERTDYFRFHAGKSPHWILDDRHNPKDPASHEVRRALSSLLQLRLALGPRYGTMLEICMFVKPEGGNSRQLAVFNAFKGGFMNEEVWFLMHTTIGDSVVSIEDIVRMALVDGAKPQLNVCWCYSF